MTAVADEALDDGDRHEILATARLHGADLTGPIEGAVGFVVAVRRRLGLPPTDWSALGHGDALLALDDRLRAATLARRPAEPCGADEAVARALHSLRPAGLPWAGLAPAAHLNLTRDAGRLRAALERHGWTPPPALNDHHDEEPPR